MATDNELENGGVATTEPTSTPTEFKTRIKLKRDTEENWNNAADKTILNGEVVLVDTEDGRLRAKIGGDGTKYKDLEFIDNIHVITDDNKDDDIPANAIIVIDTTQDSVGEVGGGTTGGGTVIDGSAYMPNIAVTSEDNGKVLGVVNGRWAKMTIQTSGSGSEGTGGTGQNGVSPTVTVDEIEGGHKVTIVDVNDTHVFCVMDGKDGVSLTFGDLTDDERAALKGEPGEPGASITVESVVESDDDGGDNVITFSDGTIVKIKNGSKGSDGSGGSTDTAVSWENITDKPFGQVGNKYTQEDLAAATTSISYYTVRWKKVAEPYDGTLLGAIFKPENKSEIVISENNATIMESGSTNSFYACNVLQDGESFTISGLSVTLTFSEKGLYIANIDINGNKLEYFLTPNYSFKKIDEAYLPETAALPDNVVTTDENGLIPRGLLPAYWTENEIKAYIDEKILGGEW